MATESGFPTSPQEFGRELRRMRESAGLSIEDIASETKISSRILTALEEGKFQYLPEKVFSTNFVRQVGHLIGMDEDRLAGAFAEAWERFELASGSHPAILALPPAPQRSIRWTLVIPSILAVVGFLVAAVLIWRTWHQPRELPGVAMAPTATVGISRPSPFLPSPAPATSATVLPAAAATQPPVSPTEAQDGYVAFTVRVEPLGECWLRYRDATGRTARETVGSGETREFQLPAPVRLTLGNAGAVSVEVAGRRFTDLGMAGQVVHLEVTPEGLKKLRPGSGDD